MVVRGVTCIHTQVWPPPMEVSTLPPVSPSIEPPHPATLHLHPRGFPTAAAEVVSLSHPLPGQPHKALLTPPLLMPNLKNQHLLLSKISKNGIEIDHI